ELLEDTLHQHGVSGWRVLLVSNEVGLRKDTGQLYEYALTHFGASPAQLVMVGDNERADIQIPTDMGAQPIPLLRPVELARSLPRFAPLIAAHEHQRDIDAEITLGLVLQKNFSPIHFPAFDPDSLVPVTPYHLGYSLIGPVAVSFSQWVLQQAREDGLQRLYFLSREGKPLKAIYDCWTQGEENAPQTEYLVVSRRAAGLAAIASLDDILDIAKTTYYPNKFESYLHTRYGITLSEARWGELAQKFSITPDTLISIQNRKIEPLIPWLQALEGEIMAQVQLERRALMHYLEINGLTRDDHQAVVDVGYGGSVQGYLNKLLVQKARAENAIPNRLHGYYLMTDERAQKVSDAYQVRLHGGFFENVQLTSNMPVMYQHSFNLEKLLSTNEPQIESYELDAAGNIHGHSRPLLPEELACADIRNQLLAGALDFAKDARRIRETLLPDFHPSRWTAQMLMEAFLAKKSQQESDLLSQIVLDDYYCGRDLVS
ncbi:MAG TPA: HAD hydrolase-like protein, partial [Anaerolineales bacterium]|nr:HAD hydrolase-like protein [Anaerolineales bacterium]